MENLPGSCGLLWTEGLPGEKKSVKFILHSVDGAINYGVIRLNCYRYGMNTYAICDSPEVTEIASKSRKQKPYPVMVFVQAQS